MSNKEAHTPNSDGNKKSYDSRGPRRPFGRRKVCPFLADKKLVLDFKNIRTITRFLTETGKIVPRHVSGVSAKNQRKLTKEIKRARNLGMIAPKMDA